MARKKKKRPQKKGPRRHEAKRTAPPPQRVRREPRYQARTLRGENLVVPASTLGLLEPWGDRREEIGATLANFIARLLNEDRAINLTGDREPAAQWSRHVEDAIAVAALIERELGKPVGELKMLDVGSGGGVPGLVFAALWPGVRVDLLESSEAKARHLRISARELGLKNVEVIDERAETAGRKDEYREQYDWVSARAVADLPRLAEWGMPFVKYGGRLIAIKGADIDEELADAKRALRVLGASEPPRDLAYTRPDGKACRVVVARKSARTPSTYPRRVGVMTRFPL